MPFICPSPSPVPWVGTASGYRAGFVWERCFIQVWGSVEKAEVGVFSRPQQAGLEISELEKKPEQGPLMQTPCKPFLLNKKRLPQALPTVFPDLSGLPEVPTPELVLQGYVRGSEPG